MNGLVTVAYIDAGSGSYLLAAIAGGATTAWFFIRSKFPSLGRRGKSDAQGAADTPAE